MDLQVFIGLYLISVDLRLFPFGDCIVTHLAAVVKQLWRFILNYLYIHNFMVNSVFFLSLIIDIYSAGLSESPQ